MNVNFSEAVPVWLKGRQQEWNQMAGFHTAWHMHMGDPNEKTTLRITGADAYRIWVNGDYVGYGPARTASGYARVDEWHLNQWAREGENHLAIEVLSHGIDCYVWVLQPPFLQAELIVGDGVVASTPDGFSAYQLTERIQKTERFSKQRPFAEAYRLTPTCNDWRTGAVQTPCDLETVSGPELLPRNLPLPKFECVLPKAIRSTGTAVVSATPTALPPMTSRTLVGKRVLGYSIDELEIDISSEVNALVFNNTSSTGGDEIPANSYALYDFGIVQCGFIGIDLRCTEPTKVYLMFDEVDRRSFNLGVGAVVLDLEAGDHTFETMDPYSLRFLRIVTTSHDIGVQKLFIRDYAYPIADAADYTENDPVLAEIFASARQTFRTNSVDLFTDCPSRERGGYPCDSWFTARAERLLTGESRIERNFLENYFLPDHFDGIPKGMVPHCYPRSHFGNGAYIPNWGIWLMLQLTDYCRRTGDDVIRDLARNTVEGMVDWFNPHLNEEGLLEDLTGWIFVEWSAANNYVSGVNYPTNMLYAKCLEDLATLYDRDGWSATAARMKQAVKRESWDGRWFADQSIRVEGKLQRTDARTETCQYHALWTGVTDRQSSGDFWERLRDNYGSCLNPLVIEGENLGSKPDDKELEPAGLLFGILLRFDLLRSYGDSDTLLNEVKHVFGPQASQTGTLWEHTGSQASCNHGFASCACDYILNPRP